MMRSRIVTYDLLKIVSHAWSNAGLEECTANPGRDTSTGCSGHVSVIMQRQFQQFVEFFVPSVQFLDRMGDIPAACRSWHAQCTLCSRPWRSHRYSSGDGSACARGCATTGALVGIAQCFVRWWKHVMHHPGWLLEEFHDFLHDGVDSAPVLDSRPARRRPRQWHVPYRFAGIDAPRAVFPRLPAVCREVHSRCFCCSRLAHGNLYIIFFVLPVFFSMFNVRNFARVDFCSPRALTGVSARRLGGGGGADAGSSLSDVGPPVVRS